MRKKKGMTFRDAPFGHAIASNDPVFWKKVEYLINFLKHGKVETTNSLFVFIASMLEEEEKKDILKGTIAPDEEIQWGTPKEIDDFAEMLENNWAYGKKGQKLAEKVIAALERKLETAEMDKTSFLLDRLEEVEKTFSFNKTEMEMLLILYLSANDREFDNLFDRYNLRGQAMGKVKLLELITEFTGAEIRDNLSVTAPLQRYGIIDSDLDINYHISSFLEGLGKNTLASEYYCKYDGEHIPLSKHDHVADHVEILKALILNRGRSEGVNIIIYGPPGTGKTEFVKSLAGEIGFDLFQINQSDESNHRKNNFRFTAVKACLNCVGQDRSVIMIDEADELLNGTGGMFMSSRNIEKGVVNDLLDESKGVCVWITNTYKHIDNSTRRRFDYSIEFPRLNPERRRRIWRDNIKKLKLKKFFSKSDIAYLTEEYDLSVAGIILALKNFKRIKRKEFKDLGTLKTIESIIKAHQKIMSAGTLAPQKPKFKKENYCFEALNYNSSIPLDDCLAALKQFHAEVYKNDNDLYAQNMNMLLYGPPGTGKTEFAKYAAKRIGAKIVERKGSDLLNMYVGGTEQLIREAFREAEAEKAILFIDEADGLIAERSGAHRNWEVTQVNEFLAQMEQFRGILFCATNFKANLDAASIRRFGLKIEFDYLNDDGKLTLYKKLLKPLATAKLAESERERLIKLENLAPGDFKVARQKFFFLSKKNITHTLLIDALEEEVKAKNKVHIQTRKIGF